MSVIKRMLVFFTLNFCVILALSTLLNLLHIRPYLTAYGLDLSALMWFCLLWGMGGATLSLLFSKTMARWIFKLRVISTDTQDEREQKILSITETIARKMSLPKPQVAIYSSSEINAFATGPSKNRSLIALSSQLIASMSWTQLSAIIGHEMAHIANGDMVTMTLLQGVVNAFVMFLARVFSYILVANRNDRRSSFPYYFTNMVLEGIFMMFALPMIAFLSRKREFRADKEGAAVTSKEQMISALLQIGDKVSKKRSYPKSYQSMMMHNPQPQSIAAKLFATHPPISERVRRLQSG